MTFGTGRGYRAQLLPDIEGCRALRKLMKFAIDSNENPDEPPRTLNLTTEEMDALYELNAKLTADMRRA